MNEFRIQTGYRRKYRVIGLNVHEALIVAVAIQRNLVQTQPYHVHIVTMVSDNDSTRGADNSG